MNLLPDPAPSRRPPQSPVQHGRESADPVLGRCLAFSGRRDWLWRRIFLFVLGTFAAIIFLCLGASGYQSSVPHNNVLLAFWPLLPAALSGDDSAELRGDVTAAFGGDAAI